MRLFMIAALTAAILILCFGPTSAQDKASGSGRLNPDLPIEKPLPEDADDDEEEEEDAEQREEEEDEEETTEEEVPENPPPEFFEEPIETAEVIFVIDRTGSMTWPSKMSVVDENGNPVNNCAKIDVARIELIKTITDFAESMKFAMVGYSTPSISSPSYDANWDYGARRWTKWPPVKEPAPWGWHRSLGPDSLPVWPSTRKLVPATTENKASAIGWAQANLTTSTARGLTCIYGGMSVGLKMVSPPPPSGGGSEPKKSATAVYLLTDGAPTHIESTTLYYPSGYSMNDATWEQQCMDLTKTKVLTENIHNATIYTLGMGMNMAAPNCYVWNPGKNDWDFYPTAFNDKCRKFLTELAEATGGHYREVSQ